MPHARQHRLWDIDERGCQQQRGHFVQVEHLTSGIDEGAHRTPLASTLTDPWATAARRISIISCSPPTLKMSSLIP